MKKNIQNCLLLLFVLSTDLSGHTEGISAFIKMKTGIPLVVPHSFSASFLKKMTTLGLKPVLVGEPSMICEHLFTSDMKSLGVVKCGATHCKGESQIALFREAYGDDYFELGVGNKIVIE